MTTSILDASALPPSLRHVRIFETFDALSVGDSLVVVNDHYPLPLLYQLQAEHQNQFDWSVLELTPMFRIEVHRRDASEPRGVAEYFSWDHERLDALFERGCSDEFACGLERHIEVEERGIFPVFERERALGPTAVMRMEHERIGAALRPRQVDVLAALPAEHNLKEERMLYPAIDRSLTEFARGRHRPLASVTRLNLRVQGMHGSRKPCDQIAGAMSSAAG